MIDFNKDVGVDMEVSTICARFPTWRPGVFFDSPDIYRIFIVVLTRIIGSILLYYL